MHPLAAAVVRERYRKEAFMAAMRILGEGQLSLTKFLLITDARVSLKDFRPLLGHILERADFATDLFVISNVSQDTLDYSSRTLNEGSKAILMGLGDKRYHFESRPREELQNPLSGVNKFLRRAFWLWRALPGARMMRQRNSCWRNLRHSLFDLFAWSMMRPHVCAMTLPFFGRYLPVANPRQISMAAILKLNRYHVSMSAPIVFDCRLKPWFPPMVEPDPETVRSVDDLWPRIF